MKSNPCTNGRIFDHLLFIKKKKKKKKKELHVWFILTTISYSKLNGLH